MGDATTHAEQFRRAIAGAALLGLATTAAAQQGAASTAIPPDADSIIKLDKVEVTGSRIARIDGESGLPVQIITREELLDGGVQTMQDLLQRISANQSYGGFTEAQGIGKLTVGFTAASLRGLGSQRTLVLLNGRRLAPYALSGGQSVDLSGIPASALERVEVLKDGASAVYGSDAIGGVINFILRKDYQGVEVNANYFGTEQGGGNNGRANITGGWGDLAKDKYNFFLSADYFRQDALAQSQRESTRTYYLPALGLDDTSRNSFPGNILQTLPSGEVYGFKGTFNPTIPFPGGATPSSCAPPISFVTTTKPFRCSYDPANVADAIPESEKANILGRATWQINPDTQFFAEGSYYHGRFTQHTAPTPVDGNSTGKLMQILPSSTFYPKDFVATLPGGDPTQPVQLNYRTIELGPRTNQANVDQWNAVAGLQGAIADWDYQLAATYTTNQQRDHLESGFLYASKFGALLESGVVNPFAYNTSAVVSLMRAAEATGQVNDNRASNYGLALQLSNTVYKLPAGQVAVAFGAEARRESLEQSNADFITTGDILSFTSAVPSLATANRNVYSLFGEANIPITKTFEADLALRYDYYSDFGGTTNPKVTLRWQPVHEVLLRAAYGTGFRAPTLSNLFQPQTITNDLEGYDDPVRCPVTDNYVDCDRPMPTKEGGNPLLQPETSKQVNAGVVYQPTRELSLGADYYWVTVNNVINTLPIDSILYYDYAKWAPGYVVRRPPDAQNPNLPGVIDYVVQYPTNVGAITTSGIDLNLQWNGPETTIGRFTLVLNGTYVLKYNHTEFDSDSYPSAVGWRGADGAISRYRQYAQLNWTLGPWAATLANTYQSGYNEYCFTADPSGCDIRHVGAYSIWDLQGRYTGVKDLTLTLGIRNAMDTPPPLTNQTSNSQSGIDPTYADPRGRTFYGAVRYAFK